jgi:hypothetical protein
MKRLWPNMSQAHCSGICLNELRQTTNLLRITGPWAWGWIGEFWVTTRNVKARLHGYPRLINAVESTKRVNSSFQRKWSSGLTVEQVADGQLSLIVVDSPSFFFFFLNSHILQQHLPAQVHLPPFRNRLPRSLLWNRVKSIVQPLNSISLIQPRWSAWGTRVNAPLRALFQRTL